MHISRRVLIVVILCMGTAFAFAFSSSENTSGEVVGATVKDRSSADSQVRNKPELSQADTRFDLSAPKRAAPSKIKRSDLFDPKSWLTSNTPPSDDLSNPLQAQVKVQGKDVQVKALGHVQAQNRSQVQQQQQSAASAMPFTFVGRMIDGDEVTLFLVMNERQYLVKANDVLDGSYRIDKITDRDAVMTYLPTSTQQTLTFNSTAVGSLAELRASVPGSNLMPLILGQPQQQPIIP